MVLEITSALKRNPVPYLLGIAMGANIGSTATITGNPQNMLIGSYSGIHYRLFAARLALWPWPVCRSRSRSSIWPTEVSSEPPRASMWSASIRH
jgi:hypothetical protein